MFGRRADGRRLNNIDPIIQFTPYIMPTRNDASNQITVNIDYEPMADYIRTRSKQGVKITFMDLIIAAYVRTVSQYPEVNRFVMNRQIFARNQIVVSLTVLKNAKNRDSLDEDTIKMHFAPNATIDEVAQEVARMVTPAANDDADGTSDFAGKIVRIRPLVKFVVFLARVLDRYGLLPGWLYDLSPFHCSMFITNLASIGLPGMYHHLYNFGNTSVFLAMGKFEKQYINTRDGIKAKTVIPLGVNTDERICGGASYAMACGCFMKYINNPKLLEERPETIKTEVEYKPFKK